MRCGGMVAVLALAVAACGSQPTQTQPSATAGAQGDAVTQASSDAPPAPPTPDPAAKGRDDKVENDLYSFGYSYPGAASAIDPLRVLLDKRLADAKADLISSARSGKADADKDGFPYHAYTRQIDWKVVTDLPGWLSLSADYYEYSGGAHGMSGFDTLLWDRGAQVARKPIDLFASAEALRGAIRTPFCDALDVQRAQKRGEPVQRDGGEMFSECIDPAAQTLILGSSNRKTFDRIGLLVAPYEAGPYAEGSYEVTVPVTAKVMAVLKPQYRSAFSVKP